MKSLLRTLTLAMVVPIFWLTCLVINIMVFSSGRPTNFFARLFEDFVFVTSFLFYRVSPDMARGTAGTGTYLWAFASQFLFWWLFAFFLSLIWQKYKHKN